MLGGSTFITKAEGTCIISASRLTISCHFPTISEGTCMTGLDMLNTVAEANNRASIGWLPRDIPWGEHSPGGETRSESGLDPRQAGWHTRFERRHNLRRVGTIGRAGDSIAQGPIGIN